MSEHGRILEQTIRDFRRRRTGLLVLRGLALSLGLLRRGNRQRSAQLLGLHPPEQGAQRKR